MRHSSEWQLRKSYREYLALAIVLSIGYVAFKDPLLGGSIVTNLNYRTPQIFVIFSISALIFAYGVTKNEFKEWTFWAGVSASPTGIVLAISRVGKVIEYAGDSLQDKFINSAVLCIFSVVAIVVALTYFFIKQAIRIGNNTMLDRILSVVGLVFTLLMFWGQYLPWNRSIYSATNTNWKFEGSGSQVYIKECCYLTEFGWTEGLMAAIPLLFLLLLFVLRVFGFKISNLGILGLILWGVFEVVNLLEDIGFQDPVNDAGWSASDVSTNGLTYEIEIMFGGYLFMGALIGLVITLLLPRVLKGRADQSY